MVVNERPAIALPVPGAAGPPKACRRALGLLLAATLGASGLGAPAQALYLEAGAGRRQGDFGTPTTSTLELAYAAAGLVSSRYDLNLTVPVLSLRNRDGGRDETATGLGDVLLRGMWRLWRESREGASLDGGLSLKLPTASSERGLGTGRPDLGAFAALNQRWDRLQASLLAGWIQSPSAPEATRTGIPVAGLGLSWYAARGKYSVAYQARGAAEADTPAPRELAVDIYQALGLRTALKATYVAGLSDGTAKSSFGLGLVFYP
jgi:hypothetical protein